jgi:hypothetical protein
MPLDPGWCVQRQRPVQLPDWRVHLRPAVLLRWRSVRHGGCGCAHLVEPLCLHCVVVSVMGFGVCMGLPVIRRCRCRCLCASQPVNCGPNSSGCVNGTCVCDPCFSGPDCMTPLDCGVHGTCAANGTCICTDCWGGEGCNVPGMCRAAAVGSRSRCVAVRDGAASAPFLPTPSHALPLVACVPG